MNSGFNKALAIESYMLGTEYLSLDAIKLMVHDSMDETDRTRISVLPVHGSGREDLLYEVMKRGWLITLIGIFIPGGGQIYQGSYLKAS